MNLSDTVLDESAILDGGQTLGDTVSDAVRATAGLLVVRRDGRPGDMPGDRALAAVPEIELRRAAEDRADPATPIADLCDARCLVVERAEAERRLAEDPTLPGILVTGSTQTVVVAPVVEPIRTAIVMAGGFGTRLRPLTDDVPKPLLGVGGRPLLHRILGQLRAAGVQKVAISVHYLAEAIEESIGDGSDFGLEVRYLREDTPLDTGAGLVLLGESDGPFFVVNGDILTTLDFASFGRHHRLSGRLATMATWLYANPLAYGVVETEGTRILGIAEKPVYRYPINSGIYAFSETVLDRVARGRPLAMVDFLLSLIDSGEELGRFPILEYWNDVGSHDDYERAQAEVHEL